MDARRKKRSPQEESMHDTEPSTTWHFFEKLASPKQLL